MLEGKRGMNIFLLVTLSVGLLLNPASDSVR